MTTPTKPAQTKDDAEKLNIKKNKTDNKAKEGGLNHEPIKFKGRFVEAVGRRKTSVARVRLYKKGNGVIIVNEKRVNDFFSTNNTVIVKQPLKLTSHLRDLNFSILVKGGGSKGQAEASRHGIVRTLLALDEDLKAVIKAKGWISRDSRKKERKKPGLKKARKAGQWSKR